MAKAYVKSQSGKYVGKYPYRVTGIIPWKNWAVVVDKVNKSVGKTKLLKAKKK